MINKCKAFGLMVVLACGSQSLWAQDPKGLAGFDQLDLDSRNKYLENPRAVTTAVPIMGITPDARAAGMGDVGVASDADVNSIYWNPAKLAFLPENTRSLSLSYTPWLNKLVNDINLAYLSGVVKIDERQAISAAMRYFSLGEINFRGPDNQDLGVYSPYEMSLNAAYALKLSETFSMAVGLRYIYSNLTQGQQISGLDTKAGKTIAADVGMYYKSDEFNMDGGLKQSFSAGLNLSNVGGKISYSNDAVSDFIPTNLRLGGGYHLRFDKYNRMSFLVDINKLMVPTPPIREGDALAEGDLNGNGVEDDGSVYIGKDDNVSSFAGMLQSFNDAPNGFKEELEEIVLNVGAEFWYDDRFAFRGGYQYEDKEKGGRQYYTIGMGLRFNVFGMDVAYLIPASALVKSPLENTLRFSLHFNFGEGA